MEGPSLFLAAEQLAPFIGQQINEVTGNTKIGKERLLNQIILSIFPHGKQLFFQFDSFALRVHFMLYGSFEAMVQGKKITGDYQRKYKAPRLSLTFSLGQIVMYNCSVRFVESSNVKDLCDFSTDIMSEEWDEKKALEKVLENSDKEIADVLLDQTIFSGIGNIIKNEVLLLAKTSPLKLVKMLSFAKLKQIIKISRQYVFRFYRWRKKFVLKKHYKIYRQSYCQMCGSKVIRKKTGERKRVSFICPLCEK